MILRGRCRPLQAEELAFDAQQLRRAPVSLVVVGPFERSIDRGEAIGYLPSGTQALRQRAKIDREARENPTSRSPLRP